MTRPITSREYKLILKADKFKNLEQGVNDFWARAMTIAKKVDGEIEEADQDEIRERETQYFDTPDCVLRQEYNFVLRLRKEKRRIKKGELKRIKRKYNVTLKYRHIDQTVSAQQDVSASPTLEDILEDDDLKIKTKFEEDVVPAKRIFAHSTSVEGNQKPTFNHLQDAITYFPGLGKLGLTNKQSIQSIQPVNDFKAYEINYRVGKLNFAGTVKVSLTFWYHSSDKIGPPLVAEFSYDYDTKIEGQEQFSEQMVETSERFFLALQQETDWVDLTGTTKTACAYDATCCCKQNV